MLVDHIRQLRSNYRSSTGRQTDRPPSYEDVVKDTTDGNSTEAEPPSYIEATNNVTTSNTSDTEPQPPQDHITMVTVETRQT